MNEVIREFLIETQENLAQLDLDLMALEADPTQRETLSRIFRTMHTIKGTAGFLALQKLQAVAHAAENLLSRLRDGELVFDVDIASALLSSVDAVRQMLQSVETANTDGDVDFSELIRTLERLRAAASAGASAPAPPQPSIAPVAITHVAADLGEVRRGNGSHAVPPSVSVGPSEPPSADTGGGRAGLVSDSSIRVDVGLLDKLMTLVGELVLARNQVMQFSSSQDNAAFLATVQRLNMLTTDLQAGVMKTRMQPLSNIWSKFPRVVRDLALACGKQARLEMDGQDTELDRTIIESIRDPLTHLVRNAIDHGIETSTERSAAGKPAEGRLALHAFHEGGKVIIEIVDDGKGIDHRRVRAKAIQAKLVTPEQADRLSDLELINLIFMPGFSTVDKVTQFSGRGVGMDVVRTNIEKIGGAVNVESRPGKGTTIRMKIPLTLAIIPALTITCDGDRYAIPQASLLELVRLDEAEQTQQGIEQIHGAPVYRLRGNLLPLVYLKHELHPDTASESNPGTGRDINIVVLQADDRQFGLVVDAIHDTEEIVVKPLQKQVKGIGVFVGATIMGDGKVALILDVLGLAQQANVVASIRERALRETPTVEIEAAANRETILLFATRDGGRMGIPLSLVDRLEEFPRDRIEKEGPLDVVQYRNAILPLIDVSGALNGDHGSTNGTLRRNGQPAAESEGKDTVQVVVYASDGQRIGLIVDQIIDIVEESGLSHSQAHRRGVLSTAVVQGRVTEFPDLQRLVHSMNPDLSDSLEPVGKKE